MHSHWICSICSSPWSSAAAFDLHDRSEACARPIWRSATTQSHWAASRLTFDSTNRSPTWLLTKSPCKQNLVVDYADCNRASSADYLPKNSDKQLINFLFIFMNIKISTSLSRLDWTLRPISLICRPWPSLWNICTISFKLNNSFMAIDWLYLKI